MSRAQNHSANAGQARRTADTPDRARTYYGWSLGMKATNSLQVTERVHEGFPTAALARLKAALDVSDAELADLIGTSLRTLARRKKEGRLTPAESDQLYRLARLYEHAVEVLESEAEAQRWLKAPQWGLGDQIPLRCASTDAGAQEVDRLLTRIDYGVLA